MGYRAAFCCLAAVLCLAFTAFPQKDSLNIAGDWNITAKDASGAAQFGAWRIIQRSTQLEVVSRWSHIEGLRQSSGTISDTGRLLIIGGPVDGWMESFSGMLSADGNEITGTWSRVEGIKSSKGSFVAQRSVSESSQTTTTARRTADAPAKPLIEAPDSQSNPPRSRPTPADMPTPAMPQMGRPNTVEAPAVETAPTPAPTQPEVAETPTMAEPPPDRPASARDLNELESLLSALVEQNQLLIRQSADVRNKAPNKEQLVASQLQQQQRVFRLLERLIHSKVELEELLELFRRNNRIQ